MRTPRPFATVGLLLVVPTPLVFAQQPDPVPLYRVTVVGRTTKAINYQYLSGPTKIDFRGTVLLPFAKGDATVESRKGSTEIDVKIEGLTATKRFGREYLTYVLWAITPEGRPHNIGELISDASDRAKLRVTTNLQAFALIVTAEPYSAVRQPSDVVVAENQVREDTLGTIKPVEAKFDLLPRGEYTLRVPEDVPSPPNSPRLSMHQYEALVEVYQAQNAVNIARSAGADRYAPDTFARATQMLVQAQQLRDRNGDFRQVVQSAREAAQTAEDSRIIAVQRQQADQLRAANAELSKAQAELVSAEQARQRALEDEGRAQADATAARAQAESAAAARRQAESEAAAARLRAAQTQSDAKTINPNPAQDPRKLEMAQKRQSRMRLFENMKGVLPTLDTGRGLVATVSDDGFRGSAIRDTSSDQLTRIAGMISANPGLRVRVEGYSADVEGQGLSRERADAVRRLLVAAGTPAGSVSAVGLGDSRLLGPNNSTQGRKLNTRVEIVISGDSIGDLPLWQQPYTLTGSSLRP